MSLSDVAQLGGLGLVVAAVVYLQRQQAIQLRQTMELLLPALDVRAELARLEGKVEALATQLEAHHRSRKDCPACVTVPRPSTGPLKLADRVD